MGKKKTQPASKTSNQSKPSNRKAERNFKGKPMWQDKDVTITSCTNDPKWYAISDSILRDVASFPFSIPVGAELFKADEEYTFGGSLPGIMKIRFKPAVGNSKGAVSQLNYAANAFYAFMRQANSGSRNYEAPDLMMYFMGIGSVYEVIARGIRAYGCLRKYSNYNLYLARTLVETLGFNYDDLNRNQTEFRDRLNTLIHKVNKSFHIPKGMPYFDRAIMRNSNVYVDHPGSKFQLYVYSQDEYLVYDNKTFNTGTALRGVKIGSNLTVSEYFDYIDTNFEDLFTDEDINIMSGDVLKAYGDSGCWQFSELPINYETQLLYDVAVLTQIHNYATNFAQSYANQAPFDAGQTWFKYPSSVLTVSPGFSSDNVLSEHSLIYQFEGKIISEPVISGDAETSISHQVLDNCILDIPVESPTPAEVMESTRLMQMADSKAVTATIYIKDPVGPNTNVNKLGTYRELYCGSECMVGMESVGLNTDGTANTTYGYPTVEASGEGGISVFASSLNAVLGFDWHPIIRVINHDETSGALMALIGDVSQATLLSAESLNRLHQAAIYGLLDVPTLNVGRSR